MTAEWRRIHSLPRRYYRHATGDVGEFGVVSSARARYVYEWSRERFERRDDAFTLSAETFLQGRLGRYDGFILVTNR